MGDNPRGGIIRAGAVGSFVYNVKSNMGNKPVNVVSWLDAARFANWLHNGQVQGAQDVSTTEDGAYDLGIDDPAVNATRKVGASWFLPNEHEWYKSAYYDPTKEGSPYWLYPTRSNEEPTIATANETGDINNPGPNVVNWRSGANWGGVFVDPIGGNVTSVGSAGPFSASHYGTHDQGGNVLEWTETLEGGAWRVQRGGGWGQHLVIAHPESTTRYWHDDWNIPSDGENLNIGFRVGCISEPAPLLGDLNGDGWVGQTDLNAVLADWGHSPPLLPFSDPSGDGLVSQDDLDIVLTDWGRGMPPASVPEPATAIVLAVAALVSYHRRPWRTGGM